jgi:AAA ATPase domain
MTRPDPDITLRIAPGEPARAGRAYRRSMTMPLLERDSEVRVLLAAAGEVAMSRRGRAVLVTGEAGTGKTSVSRAFLDQAGDDLRVLRGGCDDLRTPRTLGPLLDASAGTRGPLEEALAQGRGDAVYDAAIAELSGSRPTALVIEADQRRDRRPAGGVGADRRPPRLGHPDQARRRLATGRGRLLRRLALNPHERSVTKTARNYSVGPRRYPALTHR